MRAALFAVLLLWQIGPRASGGGSATEHLRYEREVELAAGATGQACVALDEDVFAHAASSSTEDLRLFASRAGKPEVETPFALTESGAEPAERATVGGAAIRDGQVVFDLAMPWRAYTEVDLQLDAKDFLGAAEVWGSDGQGREPRLLGAFPVFDMSSQGLARSTSLLLPESKYSSLHIELRLTDLSGRPLSQLPAGIVTGAEVPPDRNGQTIYTTVAATSSIDTQGLLSLATLTVPAHVPLERVRFDLNPKFTRNFSRDVLIAATPMSSGYGSVGAAESVSGEVFRVTREAMPEGMPPIHAQRLFVDATLGSNLRSAAKVLASLRNGAEAPLPIERVELQMRERRVCFEARPGASYTLRYGDEGLRAPVYAYARSFRPVASPALGVLGPERVNPQFVPRVEGAPYRQQHPETPWALFLVLSLITGVVVLQRVRHRQGRAD
ncbi:MAG TPA: hypothetical protein VIJ65_09250 [Acidobacteriaceae bacterium]